MKRRTFVGVGLAYIAPKATTGQAVVPQVPALPGAVMTARPARPAAAFGATTVTAALAALGAGNASLGTAIRLEAPPVATERGATIISISVELPGVSQVALLVDPAPFPLAALLRPDGAEQPWQVTIGVDRRTRVTAAVQAEGRWYSVSREIKVAAQRW
jgi:predicted secreted protein